VPAMAFETANVPCRTNPLGVKGAGEAGAIGSCPAVMNAVLDALWRAYRVRHLDMPAMPERVCGLRSPRVAACTPFKGLVPDRQRIHGIVIGA
jgi:CO/xanthine dehydrogenase Mo-binding subunit